MLETSEFCLRIVMSCLVIFFASIMILLIHAAIRSYRCVHDWVEIERTYGKWNGGKAYQISEELVAPLILGKTTIIWQCSKCKKFHKEEMLGEKVWRITK